MDAAGEPKQPALSRFRGAYLLSTFALSGLATIGLTRILIGWLAYGEPFFKGTLITITIAYVPLIPILLKGGIPFHKRLAWSVSILMALIIGACQTAMFFEFLKTHGEGPTGEGSPLAYIIAMVFCAILFFCPWLLTALRGFAAHRNSQPS